MGYFCVFITAMSLASGDANYAPLACIVDDGWTFAGHGEH